jgi:hypothetical protein
MSVIAGEHGPTLRSLAITRDQPWTTEVSIIGYIDVLSYIVRINSLCVLHCENQSIIVLSIRTSVRRRETRPVQVGMGEQ